MNRRNNYGICHVCGETKHLTFEHIPPQSSGNTAPVKQYNGAAMLGHPAAFKGDFTGVKYRNSQRGLGGYTLCDDCNSYLGRNYVQDFSAFYTELIGTMLKGTFLNTEGLVTLSYAGIPLLPIFKQIIANFCCINQPGIVRDCKDYLLDRENNHFPDRYKLYLSINPYKDGRFFSLGFSIPIYDNHTFDLISVLSMPPLVLTLQDVYLSDNRSLDLCDITSLGSCGWDKTYDMEMTPRIEHSDFFRAKRNKRSR